MTSPVDGATVKPSRVFGRKEVHPEYTRGYDIGHKAGLYTGHQTGFSEGVAHGRKISLNLDKRATEQAIQDSFTKGKAEGLEQGLEEGFQKAKAEIQNSKSKIAKAFDKLVNLAKSHKLAATIITLGVIATGGAIIYFKGKNKKEDKNVLPERTIPVAQDTFTMKPAYSQSTAASATSPAPVVTTTLPIFPMQQTKS